MYISSRLTIWQLLDIINRITWDSAFERSNYVIGFVDRFEGQLEITMGSWKKETTDEEFIPQHRVLYIRDTNGEIVWDRRRRIDKIFLSGNSAFSELAFLAWSCTFYLCTFLLHLSPLHLPPLHLPPFAPSIISFVYFFWSTQDRPFITREGPRVIPRLIL